MSDLPILGVLRKYLNEVVIIFTPSLHTGIFWEVHPFMTIALETYVRPKTTN